MPFLALIGALLIAAAWTQVTVGLRPLSTIRDRLAAIRSGASRRLGANFPTRLVLASEIDELLRARAPDREGEGARGRSGTWAQDPASGTRGRHRSAEGQGRDDNGREHRRGRGGDAPQRRAELARARIADGSANGRADVGNVVRQVVAVVRRTPDGTGLEWVVDLPPTPRRGSIRTTSPKRSAISWKMPPGMPAERSRSLATTAMASP